MRQYLLSKIQNDNDFHGRILDILCEDKSISTEENACETKKLLQENFSQKINEILLLTDFHHTLRAKYFFEKQGFDTENIISEYWLTRRSDHHKALIKKHIFTKQNIKIYIANLLLFCFHIANYEGNLLHIRANIDANNFLKNFYV